MTEMSAVRIKAGHIDGIAGLRALAVLSVVLFHINPAWLPGGFVGVDIFFVISGFVVAHSVFDTVQPSFRAYFLWFYRRRFLRILPAIYLYVLVAATLGIFFIPTAEVSKFIEVTGAGSLFGVSNIALLWKAGDYFSASSEYNTFTHTWSLAVEEQYYVLFPFVSWLVIVRRTAAPSAGRIALALVWVACLGSLVAAAWFTAHWREFAFYMLPTRFWELGIGFLLRCHGQRWAERARTAGPAAAILGALALAALLASFWFTADIGFPFPGALPPCLATAVLIGCIWLRPGGWIDGALTTSVMRFVGDISYSLYLWHWGVVVLMRWTVGLDTLPLQLFSMATMLVLAVASYRLVEKPLRYDKRLLALETPAFFAAYAAAAALIAAGCVGLMIAKPHVGLASSNDRDVWSPYAPPQRMAATDCLVTTTSSTFSGGWRMHDTPGCTATSPHRLFVMGDSHAGAYGRMLNRIASIERREVWIYTTGGCRLLAVDETRLLPGCAAFRRHFLDDFLATSRAGDILFLPGLYTPRYRDVWGEERTSNAALDRRPLAQSSATIADSAATLRAIAAHGVSIVIEAPKPTIPTALFRCADWFNRGSDYCASGWTVSRAEMERRRARPLAALTAIVQAVPGVTLWDPLPLLCTASVCDGFRAGKPLYYDTDHLSGFGNDVLLPSFRATLDKLARAPPTPPVPPSSSSPGKGAG